MAKKPTYPREKGTSTANGGTSKKTISRKKAIGPPAEGTTPNGQWYPDGLPTYSVHGTVSHPDTLPAAGLTVLAFDKDVGRENSLGKPTTTDAEGRYQINYGTSQFRHSTSEKGGADVFVRVYAAKDQLLLQSKTTSNAPADLRIDVTLPATGFVVRGTVRDSSGNPLPRVRVRAYDKDLRHPNNLGDTRTGDDGVYSVAYSRQMFARAEKNGADLYLVIVDARGNESSPSAVRFGAGTDETVDLTVETVGPVLTELDHVTGEIEPLLKGQGEREKDLGVGELNATDVAYLVNETGIPVGQIEAFIHAAKAKTSVHAIPLKAFYGWFRSGLTVDLAALVVTTSDSLMATLDTAAARQLIPSSNEAERKRIRQTVDQLRLDMALQAPRSPGVTTSLGDLLGTLPVPTTPDHRRAIAAVAAELRPDDPRLLERLREVPGLAAATAVRVAHTLRLGALTDNHLPLVQALQSHLAEENKGTLTTLAALEPDQWLDLAYTHGTPNGSATTAAAYADTLAASVEALHPTATLAAHVADGGRLARHPLLADLGPFLRDHPSFDIANSSITAIARKAKMGSVEKPGPLMKGLRAVQRLHQLGARLDETATLMERDIVAPHQILAAGPAQLNAMFGGRLSPERIEMLHAKAENLHQTTFAALTAATAPFSGPIVLPDWDVNRNGDKPKSAALQKDKAGNPTKVTRLTAPLGKVPRGIPRDPVAEPEIPEGHYLSPEAEDAIGREPTLQSLFGAQDACACGHCSSVLSPAAYFVDVLEFIRKANLLGLSGNPGLLHRRPDLEDLELSCNNTNTEVPAIDLALEILENAVALPLPISLPAGTDIEKELGVGDSIPKPAGQHVRNALKKTVRDVSGEVWAKAVGPGGPGTREWIVADGHRRWTLTLQEKAFRASDPNGLELLLDTTGRDLPNLVTALDDRRVPEAAEPAFAAIFAPNQTNPPTFANYTVNVTPNVAGKSWRVTYQLKAQIQIDKGAGRVFVKTAARGVAPKTTYHGNTISAVEQELRRGAVPRLVEVLLSKRFSDTRALTLVSAPGKGWTVTSPQRELTLSFLPAGLTITSLAYQSGESGIDAIAWPENHNPRAYVLLKGDPAAKPPVPVPAFPWSLPVDLPLEETRLYLDRAHSSRRRLIELTFPLKPPIDDAPLVLEILGMSEAEAQLIAPPSSWPAADIYGHWGVPIGMLTIRDAAAGLTYEATAPLGLLRNVSILLQQSRLTFEELQATLKTAFVTGDPNPLLFDPPDTCATTEMRLPKLTASHLDRIHRFSRLRKRLGWSTEVLDTAIKITPGNALTRTKLQALAHLIRLHELLNLPVATILEWWSVPATLTEKKRTAELAEGLKLTAEELEHARLLLDIPDLFASPTSTLAFCERVSAIQRGGISFEDLLYLLHHVATPAADVDPGNPLLLRLALSARDAVQAVLDAPELPPLPAGADAKTIKHAKDDKEATVAVTRRAREDAAIGALAAGLTAPADLVDDLLRNRLRHAGKAAIDALLDPSLLPVGVVANVSIISILYRLHKAAYLCNGLGLTPVDLAWVAAPQAANGLTALDFDVLPVSLLPATIAGKVARESKIAGYEQLLALVRLRGLAKRGGDLLHHYAALDFTVAGVVDRARQVIVEGLGVQIDQVKEADEKLGMTQEQYRDPVTLARLIELLVELKQLGATVAQALSLAIAPVDATAQTGRGLLKSKFSDSTWHDLIKPIADKLRERQREALVDFLVDREHLRGVDDLYEHYLIDVQTSSCLKTTRLLQATAAAQLYVQRLLLNLEQGATLDAGKRELWNWMQSYRVWEANRKVFLFPENYLLPELRDDKTATFRQMESSLTEGEPSPEITRAALLGYVEDLGDLAQISVIAMYQDDTTLHVIGRTPNQPFRYFWRSCAEFGSAHMSWSGWESLDLDNANDFIMPFVFEGDLHLAWPIFRKTKDEYDDTKLLWEVQLAWTRRSSQGWVKRKIGKAQLGKVRRLPNKRDTDSFAFRFDKEVLSAESSGSKSLNGEKITVDCYAANELTDRKSLQPDPSPPHAPEDALTHSVTMLSNQWNVNCEVTVVVYKWTDRDQIDGGGKYIEGWEGIPVELDGYRQDRGGTDRNVEPVLVSSVTGKDGKAIFSFKTSVLGPNGGDNQHDARTFGLSWQKPVNLTIYVPGLAHPIHKSVDLFETGKYFFYWNWNVNLGYEDKALRNHFREDRPVKYEKVGAFLFQTGTDLAKIELPTEVPPIPLDLAGVPIVNISVSLERAVWLLVPAFTGNYADPAFALFTYRLGQVVPFLEGRTLPLFLTRATRSPTPSGDQPEPYAWYVRDKNGGCYLQERNYVWSRWPDGEPFAPTYRITATVSTSALFQPAIEAQLHVDELANKFGRQLPYANYNWELFLHAPLAIADYLASQQRFADARGWLHAVFDPTVDRVSGTVPKFWRFREFDNANPPEAIAKLLTWLADPKRVDPKDSQQLEDDLKGQIDRWKANPFMPHLVARMRPSAYQWFAFFAYLDLLIGWGDQFFRRDTRESVNDATLFYVLAAKLLGPRPRTIPRPVPPPPLTYRSLEGTELDGFGNAWIRYADLPGLRTLNASQQAATASTDGDGNGGRYSSGAAIAYGKGGAGAYGNDAVSTYRTGATIEVKTPNQGYQVITSLSALAFCIPQNDKVTGFYDRLDERLFRVRHCQNIDGVTRELPLFDPPIDPLLLIRARAAGLDITSVAAGLYAPLPNYRFTFTIQKAHELATEVKSLGATLLATLEKQDAEEMALLRSSQEVALLDLIQRIRERQVEEADAIITALGQSKETVLERFRQYQKLLGKTSIAKGADGAPVVEQSSSLSVSSDTGGGVSGLGLSRKEVDQLVLTTQAHELTQQVNAGYVMAGVLSIIPNIWAGALAAGQTFGGANLGNAANAIAKAMEMGATQASFLANRMGTLGGYERRQDEWVHQSKLAVAELKQIEKQILAAEIRKKIAERELANHETQIENARKVDDFMHSKFTNQQLYRWMSSQISAVYFGTYQLALDQAQRAERAYRHELGLAAGATSFISTGYWDGLKKGLVVGDRLSHDLKRMEVAYLEHNKREYEIIKHVSLLSLNPSALMDLKGEKGECDIEVPEWALDLDYPGHYLRRIKNVAVTIPCTVGPYAGVNCTLTLLSSSIRASASATPPYERNNHGGVPDDDSRFLASFSAVQSIVTSNAQNDAGMFETNLRDERYLPFEGQGVISKWRLRLPARSNSMDVTSISDVILHIRYTAREGGADLAKAATDTLDTILKRTTGGVLSRLFSMRQDFPDLWHQFIGGAGSTLGPLDVSRQRFPLLFSGRAITVLATRKYFSVEKDKVVPLSTLAAAGAGGTEVKFKKPAAGQKLTILDLTQRISLDIDRTKPDDLPKDLLIVCGYTVQD